MKYEDAAKKLSALRKDMTKIRKEILKVRKAAKPQPVQDYSFTRSTGEPVKLSELFGKKDHLFVIHNMGTGCPYCTLWADGFNGVNDHLQNCAAFVVSSPDEPAKQAKFAASRGWKFPMVSHKGTSFAEDMGYAGADGFYPGVSVLTRKKGQILRVSDESLHHGDDFCSVWHFLDLIPDRPDWQPKFAY
jgi:predicted dithiol-disulfide oxidoreductase (DUF899 family)